MSYTRHPCKCKMCWRSGHKKIRYVSMRGKLICKWWKRHQNLMRTKPYKNLDLRNYFKDKLNAESIITSPRERHMLHLLHTRHPMMINALSALDVSQSIHMCSFRLDGIIPCLTTASRIFSPCWGRHLNLHELYALMGFPKSRFDFDTWPRNSLQHALGNTMHVAVVGAVMMALLASV